MCLYIRGLESRVIKGSISHSGSCLGASGVPWSLHALEAIVAVDFDILLIPSHAEVKLTGRMHSGFWHLVYTLLVGSQAIFSRIWGLVMVVLKYTGHIYPGYGTWR